MSCIAKKILSRQRELGMQPVIPGFSGQVLNMNSGKQEVVLFHAKTFDDAAKAADELCKRKAVILNMENVDKALTRRVVDFLSGAVYALDGRVKKVAQSTYLFCPHNMDVIGDLVSRQLSDGGEWNVVSYSVTGSGGYAKSPAAGGAEAYMMFPNEESVERAKELIQDVIDGKIVTP